MCELQGNINLIEGALAKGVKKFVLVTSIGTGDSRDAPPSQVYDVLKPVLLEKEKAEERLKVCQHRPNCKTCVPMSKAFLFIPRRYRMLVLARYYP